MRVGVIMYRTSLTKGQELVAQRMVREFRKQGHDAYLITSIYNDLEEVVPEDEVERRGGYIYSYSEALGIPVIRVRSQSENWPPRRITFLDFVSTLTRIVEDLKLNVLITHSTLWNGPEETAKFVEWKRNQAKGGAPIAPLVFCHMSHFQEPSEERYELHERTFREAWNSTSLRTIMMLADLVLVTTPFEKEQMKKLGVGENKLVLFPGGIESANLESARPGFRERYGIPEGPMIVSCVGTVEERKNAANVLKVAGKLANRSDLHFVIAGNLDDDYGRDLKAAAAAYENVSVIGPIPEEEYPSLIRESYLNINMSRSEALGLVQLEFMYNGVPVVTSGVGGQSWIVRDGSNGAVVAGPDDIEGAVAAISRLADKRKKRDKLGRKSKEIASQFTMPLLVDMISKRIAVKLGQDLPAEEMEPGERVIEAMVKRGYRVAVTTRRLIVDSAKGGNLAIIPLKDIVEVRRRLKFSWKPVAAGAVASLTLYLVEMLDPAGATAVGTWLAAWVASSPTGLGPLVMLASLPLALSVILTGYRARSGYAVSYGEKMEAFIPREFIKALRIADQMVPKELLADPLQ